MDTKRRSFLKSLTWRVFATVLMTFITYLFIGSLTAAGLLTVIYQTIQVFMYYFHERLWHYVSWGRTKGLLIQMTGVSGTGKTTVAKEVQKRLQNKGLKVEVIDADEYMQNDDIAHFGGIGKALARNGIITIISAINPSEQARREIRYSFENTRTVYVKCGLEALVDRDPKGLYLKALLPEGHRSRLNNFAGISAPFDPPSVCDLTLDTETESIKQSATKLEAFIMENI